MKKFLSLLLAAAMLCTLLVGCGSKSDDSNGDYKAFVEVQGVSGDTILVACCERQKNLSARLMVLSVNAHAMCMMTEDGCNSVLSMMDYLLDTNPANVDDCSIIFDNSVSILIRLFYGHIKTDKGLSCTGYSCDKTDALLPLYFALLYNIEDIGYSSTS